MSDWQFVETDPEEEFCRIQYFGIKKRQGGVEVNFVVAVREYVTPPDPAMPFFAEADKQVNQRSVPYTPCGWGATSEDAVWECVKSIRKFPYEPESAT